MAFCLYKNEVILPTSLFSFFPTFYFTHIKNEYAIFYEDGKGYIVDEHGVEPMDLVVDEEVVVGLTQNFIELKISRSTAYNIMSTQCNLFIKQAQLYPVERNSNEKFSKVCLGQTVAAN